MKLIGHALSGAVLVLSAVLAFRLGLTWGLTDFERSIYGAIVVVFEVIKCLLPFAVVASWRARRYVTAIVAACVCVGLAGLSFLGTVGFAELNRGALQGTREQTVADVALLRREVSELTQHLSAKATQRTLAEIESDIDALLRSPVKTSGEATTLGARTTDCMRPVGTAVETCARIAELRRERAAANAQRELQARLDDKRTKLATASGLDLAGISDPQIGVVARLLDVPSGQARLMVNIAFALLLELVGGLGFLLSSLLAERETATAAHVHACEHEVTTRESDEAAAQRYLTTEVRRDVSGSVAASAMHRDYARWCASERVTPLTLTAFGVLVARTGIAKSKIEGLIRYRNVALKSGGVGR